MLGISISVDPVESIGTTRGGYMQELRLEIASADEAKILADQQSDLDPGIPGLYSSKGGGSSTWKRPSAWRTVYGNSHTKGVMAGLPPQQAWVTYL